MKAYGKWLFAALLFLVWIIAYNYTFNEKLDLNGDNCSYYMNATSIATGHGYSDISTPAYNPTNNFPPGYPVLMAPIRVLTDSIIPQKIFNGLCMIAGVLLLYFVMIRAKFDERLAFVTGCAMILCERMLHFSTMMMSEMSFFFTSALVLYALYKMKEKKPFWKDSWFYVMLVALVLNYHIRTQGIALVAAVVLFFLCARRWKEVAGTAAGFILGCLPWVLRNKMIGVTQSRYFESISQVNPWRPEDGTLDLSGIIGRFFETMGMLVSQAMPNSIIPYVNVNYEEKADAGLWLLALVLLALVVWGFWQFGRFRWLLIGYIVFTFSVISIFSSPSENRYIVTVLPFLTIGLMTGIWALADSLCRKVKLSGFSPWILVILLFSAKTPIQDLHKINKFPFPPNYANFFQLGQMLKSNVAPETVVASRKPGLLYMFSGTSVVGYAFSSDDKVVLKGLIESKTDYVILDQLGYSSTPMYLMPAIQKNMELFPLVIHLENPDTYLLKFEREEAAHRLGISE